MKPLFAVCLVIVFIFSCESYPKQEPNFASYKHELVHVDNTKKLVTVEGGFFKPFFEVEENQKLEVPSFLIDETPVTNAEYLEFVKANPHWRKSNVPRIYADSTYLRNWVNDTVFAEGILPDAPVTNISWFAAKAYSESVGKRLPTIEEWEYAAQADHKKPNATADPEFTKYILRSYQTKDNKRRAVGTERPNYWGIYDMYGLVWEWTDNFNEVMLSGESRNDNSKSENLFCAGAAISTQDLTNYAAFIRYAMRGSLKANYCVNNLGFRCAQDIN
ncbi:MAG: formylglycine-generating enzyme family protein [Moheibacter sp.]